VRRAEPAPPTLPGASPALIELVSRGVVRSYARGRLLIEEGDQGDTIYVVLEGRLRAFSTSADGGREVTFGSYGPGEYVGEMSLDGGPRSASVEVTERARCAVITRTTLQAFIAERPEFAFELIAKVIRRARAATLSASRMALNDVYGRLRLLLDELALPLPDGSRQIDPAPTHLETAARLGCSREMVSRLLKDLERGGVIDKSRRRCWRLIRALPVRW
jgi:CRP/FNR family cyclic AMP-dependent transcriptional regulator